MRKLHGASIANSLIWAAAIVAAAIILRGTPQAGLVVVILGGTAGASITIVGDALRKANGDVRSGDSGVPANGSRHRE
jgi:hypothetical protein